MGYSWEQIKEEIYFVDGSLIDIYINNISEEQWEKWIDYVNDNYKVEWNDRDRIDFETIKNSWERNVHPALAKIFIGHIQINCHFFGDFENDIDPSEIKSMSDHERIIDYMKNVSEILDANVYLSSEGSRRDNDNYLFKIYKSIVYYTPGRI
jgi:hypothetical protein